MANASINKKKKRMNSKQNAFRCCKWHPSFNILLVEFFIWLPRYALNLIFFSVFLFDKPHASNAVFHLLSRFFNTKQEIKTKTKNQQPFVCFTLVLNCWWPKLNWTLYNNNNIKINCVFFFFFLRLSFCWCTI